MIQYHNYLSNPTDTNATLLYKALDVPIKKVVYSMMKKHSCYVSEARMEEIIHDMKSKFFEYHLDKKGAKVVNINAYIHLLFKKVVWSRQYKIDDEKRYNIEDQYNLVAPNKEKPTPIEELPNELKDMDNGPIIYIALSKGWSYKKTFLFLEENCGVSRKFIRDNAEILIKIKKVLNYKNYTQWKNKR
jgi:hypothetical protein